MLLLLDWSNYVFAQMDAVIDAFMASDTADKARELVQGFNELHALNPEAKQERHLLEAKLRKLLGSHAAKFKDIIYQAIRKPRDLVLAFVEGTDDSTDTNVCSTTAAELSSLLQQPVQFVAVADAGKRVRWKTSQWVLATAREFGQVLGVTEDEFAAEIQAAAESQRQEEVQSPQHQQQQLFISLDEEQQAAAEQQLDSDLVYRLKGALLYIAKHALEKGLEPAKPLLIPGCIADEAIAAVVHANAALEKPHPLCIKSDDSDFWQLRCYNTSSSSDKNAAVEGSIHVLNSGDGSTSIPGALSNPVQQTKAHGSSCDNPACTTGSSSSSDDGGGSSSSSGSTPQWLFHCGIKFNLQFTAASMPQCHLQKCAILGKGREELTHYGTVFGPVPDGLEVTDAAGTAVVGIYRPGDALYKQQFAAFDAAARSEEVWKLDVPDILQWLQQYSQQVPSIRARFLIKMVQHNINPYGEWSAMPQELQDVCRKAAAEVLATVPSSSSSSSSGGGDSKGATACRTGAGCFSSSKSGGVSASALAAAARKGGVGSKSSKKKVVKRRR